MNEIRIYKIENGYLVCSYGEIPNGTVASLNQKQYYYKTIEEVSEFLKGLFGSN